MKKTDTTKKSNSLAENKIKKDKKQIEESKKTVKESKLVEKPVRDLRPRYDSRQSFYGKARIDTGNNDDENKLYSYHTLVAELVDGFPRVYGTYSQTTLRHIKEWLKQLGFRAETSKQIMQDYGYNKYKGGRMRSESCKATNECGDNKQPVDDKRKLNEQVSDIAYEIEEEVCDMLNGSGKNIIESDEVDTYIHDAVKKLYNVDLYTDANEDTNTIEINGETFEINDLVNDIRGILGMDGWETIFEGDHEGGVTDDIDSLEDDVKKYCIRCGKEKEDYEAMYCDGCWEKEKEFYESCKGKACKESKKSNKSNKKSIKESLGKKKVLKEDGYLHSYSDAYEIIDECIDEVQDAVNEGQDVDEAIWEAIDRASTYNADILLLAEHYGVIDYGSLCGAFYDDFYNDVYNGIEEPEEVDDEEDDYVESLMRKYGVETQKKESKSQPQRKSLKEAKKPTRKPSKRTPVKENKKVTKK